MHSIKIQNLKLEIQPKLFGVFFLSILCGVFFILPVGDAEAAVISRPPNNLGLVGYWSFDEGAGTVAGDFSGNGNDGTFSDVTGWSSGIRGGAFFFDGDTINNISLPAGDWADIDNRDTTFSFWIKTTDSDSANGIISSQRAVENPYWVLGLRSGGITFRVQNSDGDGAESGLLNTTINDGTWHHVVVVVEDVGTSVSATAYVDGVVSGDGTNTINISGDKYNGTDPSIGRWNAWGYLAGTLDEMRVYNRALSASEIADLYSRSGSVTRNASTIGKYTDGLISHWTFDGPDMTSATATDVFGDNDGTLEDAPVRRIGIAGQALEFDGVDDYVSHPDNSDFDLGTGSLTATAWIKVKAEAPYTRMAIVGKKTNSNNIEGWKLRIQQSGDNESMHLQHSLSDGSTNVATTWFDSIDRDVWTHVIVVIDRDQDEVRIYKNGIEGESSDISDYSGDPITNGQPLRIGNQGTSAPFEGLIDDVRVYDRALSDDEITGLYNATKPFTENAPRNDQFTNGLVGYWSFDGPDVSGSTVDDVSGSSNDGTINGDASPAIGKIGQAFEFDGDGDYVDAGDSASLDLTSAITMSTWVNIDTVSVRHNIMSKYDTSGSQRAYAMDMNTENDGNVAVFLGSPDGTSFDEVKSNDGYLSANTWHHVIFTWSKNENGGNGRLFVDGEEVSYESQETKTDDMNTNNVSFKIARTYTTDRDYSGKIDDVRIYNRSLSADEVQRLYQMGR